MTWMGEQGRRYGVMAALVLLFLGPPLVAAVVFYTDAWRPASTTNHGEMIYPPKAVNAAGFTDLEGRPYSDGHFRGKWTIGYLSDGECRGLCQERLYHLRQVRLALGNDAERVQRLLVTSEEGRDSDSVADVLRMYPHLMAAMQPNSGNGIPLADERDSSPVRAGEVFVIDPQGNLMMYYPEDKDPTGLLQDLRKMLRASRYG